MDNFLAPITVIYRLDSPSCGNYSLPDYLWAFADRDLTSEIIATTDLQHLENWGLIRGRDWVDFSPGSLLGQYFNYNYLE